MLYLDPPYYGTEHYYGGSFLRDDFNKLVGLLKNMKGYFVLSINNVDETRELFKDFQLQVVPIKYSCNAKTTKLSEELIVSNYVLDSSD